MLSLTEFCDWLEKWNECRFSGFIAGQSPFKNDITSEMQRRGYEVRWFSDYTDMTWTRPPGYVSKDDFIAELEMAMRTYRALALNPDRAVFTNAESDQLMCAVTYITKELDEVKQMADGDFRSKKERIQEHLEIMLKKPE